MKATTKVPAVASQNDAVDVTEKQIRLTERQIELTDRLIDVTKNLTAAEAGKIDISAAAAEKLSNNETVTINAGDYTFALSLGSNSESAQCQIEDRRYAVRATTAYRQLGRALPGGVVFTVDADDDHGKQQLISSLYVPLPELEAVMHDD